MSEERITTAATRLSIEVMERVKASARAADRSVSAELRRLINNAYGPATDQAQR